MEVHLAPDVEKKLNDLATESGRGADELLQDALAGYFEEMARTRDMLNSRYDELKSGKAQLIDGEDALARLKAKTEAQRNRPRRVSEIRLSRKSCQTAPCFFRSIRTPILRPFSSVTNWIPVMISILDPPPA